MARDPKPKPACHGNATWRGAVSLHYCRGDHKPSLVLSLPELCALDVGQIVLPPRTVLLSAVTVKECSRTVRLYGTLSNVKRIHSGRQSAADPTKLTQGGRKSAWDGSTKHRTRCNTKQMNCEPATRRRIPSRRLSDLPGHH